MRGFEKIKRCTKENPNGEIINMNHNEKSLSAIEHHWRNEEE